MLISGFDFLYYYFFCLGDIKIFFRAEEDILVKFLSKAGGPEFNSSEPIKKKPNRQNSQAQWPAPVNQPPGNSEKGMPETC